jgi:hypothetical protein
MDQDDPDKCITEPERQHAEVSERGDEAGKGGLRTAWGWGWSLSAR